ncbi:MAG: SMC-Scp complex subunit ScpB [Armatimonadetes bacterium]|nr:SMC-Scp complex subunit ScpB [Armatimonadota bacterium]MBS1701637.1 SMC-Scp complex subunit ScpB [Armatimonadota bacterium]MBS1727298.1 SMC-Scp complex subunit ScpB [Armatimonadota bacterium]
MTLVDQLEALLFVSEAPAKLGDLARTLGITEGQVEQGLEILAEHLEASGALKLVKIAGGYQLATKAEFSELVGAYMKPQKQRLSRSIMEVLAIVAYKQPITAGEIEVVRGVQSDYGLRVLQERNLICEVGRKQTPGRPILFGTTQQFLHQFNLEGLNQLPQLDVDAIPALPAESSEADE